MQELEIIKFIDSFIKCIRLKDSKKALDIFKELLKIDCKITTRISRKIYELGNVFFYSNGLYYFNLVNNHLKNNKKNLFLRLIRQEIAYNCWAELDIEDILGVNDSDLEYFPNNPYFLNFRGIIFLEEGDLNKALNFIDQSIQLDKYNVDFLRNKAIVLKEIGDYMEAYNTIDYALGIEPDYDLLLITRETIAKRISEEETERRFSSLKKQTKTASRNIKDMKFEFIEISSLFIVILTLVIKVITFNYEGFEGKPLANIIAYQFAINLPWLFALILILIVVALIHFRRK